MGSWKTLAIALLASIGTQVGAGEIKNPWDRAGVMTTVLPTFITGGTTMLTSDGPSAFKSAKSDALAFIGSNGEIRGAQFEQASRYYRASHRSPLMTDAQLARAIAAAY